MKLSEKELEQRLWEKTHPKSKTIPVSINGKIVNAHESKLVTTEYVDSCIKPKIELASDITPLNIVEDVLAYKKAHKQQRNDADKYKTKVPPVFDEADDEDADMEKCLNDSHLDKDGDFKTPYERMSYKEQEELKELLEKSKNLVGSFKPGSKKDWNDFGTVNTHMLPDEKLVKEWKDYKARVDNFIAKHPKLPKAIINAFMLDEYPGDENKQEEQCVGGVKWEVAEFEKITTQMFETYKKKNADYGSSFDDLFDEFGMTSALIRMKDKYNRLKSITEKKDIQVKDESVEDTLLDLANYCILTVLKLRRDRDFKHASKFKK